MNKKNDNNAENKKLFKISKKDTSKKSNSFQNTKKYINNKLKAIFKDRKINSLDKLTKKFIEIVNEEKTNIINLQSITEKMNVYKRRIYDITNVLKGNLFYINIIYFYIGIELINNFQNCQIQINPKFYEFYGNYIKYINELKEKEAIKENNKKNNKIKKSELTKINNDIKRISFFLDNLKMDLLKTKRNKYIYNKSNSKNIFLIIKDLYKNNNLDFIGKQSIIEINNNSNIIKNPINDIEEKNIDNDKGIYSYDFNFSGSSSKNVYNICVNNAPNFESIIEEEEGGSEKGDDSFFNNKLVNQKRKRFPSIQNL